MTEIRQGGFILFGGSITAKYPAYLRTLKERNLSIFIIDELDSGTQQHFDIYAKDHTHPFSQIQEIVLVKGIDQTLILKQVTTWRQTHAICGLCSLKEIFVEIAALVADYLRVPSPGLRAAHVCRDKFLQRLYLSAWSPPLWWFILMTENA